MIVLMRILVDLEERLNTRLGVNMIEPFPFIVKAFNRDSDSFIVCK